VLAYVRKALRKAGVHAWITPPRGADLFADLRNDLPNLRVETVFDVGANVGQSVETYLREFPSATIFSFEPVPSTFAELKANVGGNARVKLHQLAFGSGSGELRMSVPAGHSDTAFVSDKGDIAVKVERLDRFFSGQINFLKIDAEGYDLEVLKGATRLLARRSIDAIQVEVGMSPRHSLHCRFEDVKAFMEANGMELFSIIDQTPNFIPGGPYMQRADAVFISGMQSGQIGLQR
jgi:FkbM family methyltransferase